MGKSPLKPERFSQKCDLLVTTSQDVSSFVSIVPHCGTHDKLAKNALVPLMPSLYCCGDSGRSFTPNPKAWEKVDIAAFVLLSRFRFAVCLTPHLHIS